MQGCAYKVKNIPYKLHMPLPCAPQASVFILLLPFSLFMLLLVMTPYYSLHLILVLHLLSCCHQNLDNAFVHHKPFFCFTQLLFLP